jgi:SAM-dependent methyltransferase
VGETLAAIPREYDIKGIDLSDEAVAICQAKGLRAEKNNLFQISEKFNSIICVDVVEHVPDDQKFVEHIYKILNPQGKLFLMVPSGKIMQDDLFFGHYSRYSRSSITQLLKNSNFIIESVGMFGYPFLHYARQVLYFIYRQRINKRLDLRTRTLRSSYTHPLDRTICAKIARVISKTSFLSQLLLKFLLLQDFFSVGSKGLAVIVIAAKP